MLSQPYIFGFFLVILPHHVTTQSREISSNSIKSIYSAAFGSIVMIISGGKRKASSEVQDLPNWIAMETQGSQDDVLSSSTNSAPPSKRPFRMNVSGGKRSFPSQGELSSSPNAAPPSKRPFRMNVSGGKRNFPSQVSLSSSTNVPSKKPFRMNVSGVKRNVPSQVRGLSNRKET